jgi:hypothetical protein
MLAFASMAAAADIPPAPIQIAGAVLAAPAELRDGAAVLGYDAQGKFGPLREGKNEMVCLATDPTKTALTSPATTRISSRLWPGDASCSRKK